MKIANDISFGVELEAIIPLTSGVSKEDMLDRLRDTLIGIGLPTTTDYDDNEDTYEYRGKASPSHWVIRFDDSVAPTDEDKTHFNTQNFLRFEISSPVLKGKKGLSDIQKMFVAVASLNGFANETCGYHVHFSPQDRRYTKEEVSNFVQAAFNEEPNYNALIAEERITNEHCRKYLSSQISRVADIPNATFSELIGDEKYCKITLKRVVPLDKKGRRRPFKSNPHRSPFMKTIESRGKEAKGFEKDNGAEHLDFTATMVNFTSLAIASGKASFADAARMTCADRRGRGPVTRTVKLARQIAEYSI
ncbi:MAG: amidoligase family protein [Alphaproteobacteria bacterium]